MMFSNEKIVEIYERIKSFRRGENLDDLREAMSDFAQWHKDDDSRRSIIMYLTSLTGFLDGHQVNSDPILDIIAAFVDLDGGNVPPLVRCDINHRPRTSTRRRIVKQTAVTAVELLVDIGLTRQQAAKRVAKVLLRHNYVVQTKRSDALPETTVLGWHKRDDRSPFQKITCWGAFTNLSPNPELNEEKAILETLPSVLEDQLSPLS